MSLFGALSTAISGLTSQSAALSNVSNNIANSQTVGYKQVDTSFINYVTGSSATQNGPTAVVAVPDYINTVEGTITQVNNPLAMAISGQGFFPVSQNTGSSATAPVFNPQQFYTRAGDFTMNAGGYLVNSAGNYLQGWTVTNGTVNQSSLAPIQITQAIYAPVATANMSITANLPPNPTSSTPITTDVPVYDSKGQSHTFTMSFQASTSTANTWTVSVNDDLGNTVGTATVAFGANGTLASVTQGGVTQSTAGGAATMSLATLYPTGTTGVDQGITLNLGTIGGTSGLTQFAATNFTLGGISQDGVPPGSFSSVTTTTSGDVIVNYNNGQNRTIAQVPIVTFAAADALQTQSGSAYTATEASGTPLVEIAGTNGAGTIATSSQEQSNVDIATEFSKLIVAQQAYSANAKMVTTSNSMMQTTLDMKQ